MYFFVRTAVTPEGEKKLGVPVLKSGQNLLPPALVGIGLTNLPKIGSLLVPSLGIIAWYSKFLSGCRTSRTEKK